MIRVWLAASSAVARAGLAALVEGDGVEIGGASDLTAAALADAFAGAAAPVLVLSAGDGWAEAIAARADLAGAAVVVVGAVPGDGAVLDALPLRGWAVVADDGIDDGGDGGEALRAAIGAANAGMAAVPGGAAGRWFAGTADDGDDDAGGGARNGDVGAGESLTPRERDVLAQVALGRSNRQIAHALGITENTVKFHLATVYAKLGVASRTEAVTVGLRRGDVTL